MRVTRDHWLIALEGIVHCGFFLDLSLDHMLWSGWSQLPYPWDLVTLGRGLGDEEPDLLHPKADVLSWCECKAGLKVVQFQASKGLTAAVNSETPTLGKTLNSETAASGKTLSRISSWKRLPDSWPGHEAEEHVVSKHHTGGGIIKAAAHREHRTFSFASASLTCPILLSSHSKCSDLQVRIYFSLPFL